MNEALQFWLGILLGTFVCVILYMVFRDKDSDALVSQKPTKGREK